MFHSMVPIVCLLFVSIRVRTAPPVSVRVRNRVSVSFSFLRFCALKLIFKLISIADCAPSFELVPRCKYSEWAIFTATLAVKIASQLLAVNIASAITQICVNK